MTTGDLQRSSTERVPHVQPSNVQTAYYTGAALAVAWLVIYLLTVSPTVNFIDSGELITALYEPGIVHPPGYPLYTLLGFLASHLLWGEVAWRVNVFSAFWGAAAIGCLYLLIVRINAYTLWLLEPKAPSRKTKGDGLKAKDDGKRKNEDGRRTTDERRRTGKTLAQSSDIRPSSFVRSPSNWVVILSAAAGASLLAASATFWSRTAQAKMYTLHYFFVALLFLLAVNYRWAYERGDERQARRWLVLTAVALGLSFTNHLMTLLLVPGLLVLLFLGRRWRQRALFAVRQLPVVAPALLLPLLLYLYLPLRSSQGPFMNWGSPDTLADFWRHVRGWQYSAYFSSDFQESLERLSGFVTLQWSWLSWLVLPFGVAALLVLFRWNPIVATATLMLAALTIAFSVVYGISEIEPYLTPMYMMIAVWLGSAPPLLSRTFGATQPKGKQTAATAEARLGLASAVLLVVLAIGSAVVQFARQNHSNDHLAEIFVRNAAAHFEPNAVVITDHWDLYSPNYYMQRVMGFRPDIAWVDKSLLRYPWYLGQLEKQHPDLVEKSRDLAERFKAEQRKWIDGQPYSAQLLSDLYSQLLSSFVERNPERPAYVFFTSSDPAAVAENNSIAPGYARQPAGIAQRLLREPPIASELPPLPQFDLRGYTQDRTALDEFGVYNAGFYVKAYLDTGYLYSNANRPTEATDMLAKAQALCSRSELVSLKDCAFLQQNIQDR